MKNLLKELWANKWVGKEHLEARGGSGGILFMWDKRELGGGLIKVASQLSICKFTGINQDLTWYLSQYMLIVTQ